MWCLLAGDLQTGSLTLQHGTQPELGSDVTPLELAVEHVSRSILRVKLGAAGRWEVPRSLFKTDNISLGAPSRSGCLHALALQRAGSHPGADAFGPSRKACWPPLVTLYSI